MSTNEGHYILVDLVTKTRVVLVEDTVGLWGVMGISDYCEELIELFVKKKERKKKEHKTGGKISGR